MSSPAAQARQKRRETRGEGYMQRPADVPSNSPVPRYGWLAQHALIMSQAIVLKAMWSLRPAELPNGRGALLKDASITRIAKATARFTNLLSDAPGEPMPRRTVAHCLAAIEKKGFGERWETESRAATSPTGTSWRIRRYDEILQRWADDPNIATAGKRAFWVKGKGRWHLTPEQATAWKLDAAIAAKNPTAHAAAPAIELPEGETTAPAAPIEDTAPPTELDLVPLTDALIEVCGAAEAEDAAFVWRRITKVCGARPLPSIEDATRMVHSVGRERRKISGSQPITPGFIEKKVGGRVEAWQKTRVQDASAKAKQERWARDNRIDSIAVWIRNLQRDDLPPDERTLLAEQIAAADPNELEEASRLIEQSRSRTA